ncbi:helix-turn-helix transcriptional regulator [Conexibacter sp. JD483]|uniref:PadR family transcriptional regulator n=1 Tax=unclassified Conexibacter TaxID=2627773 RepID=UPI002720018F|nr:MULTISPECIES: helix-turn-helix transcriptional regulator [unclassified Conexibacter]MDO8186078.1 helix-turn-helix transcriptional regulator [Conexibacter sp. CPCC 205706]MDO8199568.1 helix-turn-helix transcriptional regulator [Conexibacter sp. CPCC 205762]MDR9372424.1 helix-turn-helix transcriptional regulator [Conexibacter sp. JD483]
MRTKRELSSGEWAVLALLCERPAHGYAIAAAMGPEGEIGQIWALGQPLTYRALQVLQRLELVVVAGEKAGVGAPRRTELKATGKARRAVAAWLVEPVQRPRDLRSQLLLKLAFLRRLGSSPAPLLRAQREVLERRLAELVEEQERASETLADVLRWRAISAEAGLRFVDELLAREAGAGQA